MALSSSLILALLMIMGAGQSSPCQSIEKVDFKNTVIHVNRYEIVKLVGGRACTSDSTDPKKCDWEWTIHEGRILTPEPGKQVRMIVLNANHKTGSGAWDYLIFFGCKGGKVAELSENKYLYGCKVTFRNEQEFFVTSGFWLKNDSPCCPSREKQETFRWNPQSGVYVLRTTAMSIKKSIKQP
jgi:hypothetical protein